MLRDIFFSLSSQTSIGLMFTVLFIPLSEVGKLYFRVTTYIALVLLLLALLSNPFGSTSYLGLVNFAGGELTTSQTLTYLSFISSIILIVFYNLLCPKFHKPLLFAIFLSGIFGICSYASASLGAEQASILKTLVYVSNSVGSTLLLGSVLGAMITGHWYLVQHRLGLTPLKNSSAIYIFSILLRILVVAFTAIFYWKMSAYTMAFQFLSSFNFQSLIFFCRFAVGLVLPLVLGLMVWATVKIHSTQSATGILYATIVLVLTGETFAKFLYFTTGMLF